MKKILKNPKIGAVAASSPENETNDSAKSNKDNMDKKPAAVVKKSTAVKKSVVKKPAPGKTVKKKKTVKASGVTVAIPKKKSPVKENDVIELDDEEK